jgi:hypothetical protein
MSWYIILQIGDSILSIQLERGIALQLLDTTINRIEMTQQPRTTFFLQQTDCICEKT